MRVNNVKQSSSSKRQRGHRAVLAAVGADPAAGYRAKRLKRAEIVIAEKARRRQNHRCSTAGKRQRLRQRTFPWRLAVPRP